MSEPAQVSMPPGPGGPERADVELISAAREGDADAYGILYARHVRAVRALARQMARDEAESDDLVAETFARVLDVLRRGGGPEAGFRAYALTAMRRIKYDRARGETRQVVLDDLDPYAPGVPFDDPALEGLERSMVARAFASLPERWQTVLWHTEIEGERPAQVAPLLGISAGSVAALAYRAREGLRQAYLQMHLSGAVQEGCQPALERMGAYVRGGLARRQTRVVERHLDECERCRGLYLEIADVNSSLRTIIGPIVLGPAVGGYLTSVHGGGLFSLLWLRHLRRVPMQAAAAAAAVVALAVGLPLGWMAWQGGVPAGQGGGEASLRAQASPQPPAGTQAPSKNNNPAAPPPSGNHPRGVHQSHEPQASTGDGGSSSGSQAGPASIPAPPSTQQPQSADNNPSSPKPPAQDEPNPPSPNPPRGGAPPQSPPLDRPGNPPPKPPPDNPPRRVAPPQRPAPPNNPPPPAARPEGTPSPPSIPPRPPRPGGPEVRSTTGPRPQQHCGVGLIVGPVGVCVRVLGPDAPEVRVTVEAPASP